VIVQLIMIFADAIARGIVSANPAEKLKLLVKYPQIEKVNHPSVNWKNAPGCVTVLLRFELPQVVKLGYLFLILTAERTTEVLEATLRKLMLRINIRRFLRN
jgi:hypothetical protein